MISVTEARKLILENSMPINPMTVGIENSLGSVLSEDVVAPHGIPFFNQSAMDGYAIRFSDYAGTIAIKLNGESAAGKGFKGKISFATAVRIFTGAPVPKGADTIVIQENVSVHNDMLTIHDPTLKKGSNIRKKDSQIKKGRVALKKGSVLSPGGIGYLAAMGITRIKVIPDPRVTVIVTGNELAKPGSKPRPDQIFESNSYALENALRSIHLKADKTITVKDNEKRVLNTLKKSIADSDMVLVTGGISVGKYDFVGKALKKLGVENIFYKIKQKPGKPLFFGKCKKTLIFGLPGNPAAVLSCFYEYVHPAIRGMQGREDSFLRKIFLPIANDYSKKKGLSFFLKGKIANNTVIPLDGQESYILSSFALADSIIYFPEEVEQINKGDTVEVHVLPSV